MQLSGFRLMWMMVMFDLPTTTQADKRVYTQFRNTLLDNGFGMSQYSVYFRFCGEKEHCGKYVRIIKEHAPPEGNVSILFFTDKQFAQTIHIIDNKRTESPKKPEQLMLF